MNHIRQHAARLLWGGSPCTGAHAYLASLALAIGAAGSHALEAPTNLTVTSATDTSISLSWTAPRDDGAGPIEAYNVYRCEEGPTPCMLVGDSWIAWVDDGTRFTDTHDDTTAHERGGSSPIFSGRTYRYAVAAYRDGEGDWSGQVTATAGDGSPPVNTAPSFAETASIGNLVFTAGEVIEPVTMPGASGGEIDSGLNGGELSDYSFDPAQLPEGLYFDRFSRVLDGTPTQATEMTDFALWVHDDDSDHSVEDADSLAFTIMIEPRADAVVRPDDADLWASFESEFQWFDRSHAPSLSNVREWRSTVWKGERIQKQILIDGVSLNDAISIVASDLVTDTEAVSSIPASAVSFRYPRFVKGDIEALGCGSYERRGEPTWLSDALITQPPGRADDWPADDSYPRAVWVAIDIPPDAIAGDYEGTFTISTGPDTETTLQVSLKVTEWSMPDREDRRFHLDLWQFPVTPLDRYNDAHWNQRASPWSERHYQLLEPFYRYLAELGQRSVTTYIKEGAFAAPSMVEWTALESGNRWEFDYTAFDAHVERLAQWGLDGQINAFSLVGWNQDTIIFHDAASGQQKALKAEVGSKVYNALWNDFLTDFKRHLVSKGWFDRTVLFMDEVPQDQMISVIRLIRYNDPKWKIGLAYGRAPSELIVNSLYDVSGLFESEQKVRIHRNLGQLATFYTSCAQRRPNNYVAADANPADMTAMAWYAAAQDYQGYLRWAYDNWKSAEPFDLRDGWHTAGDFSVVYRSSNEADMTVVPSIRSELLRDGIEDYEKIRVLTDLALQCDANYLSEPDSNSLENCALGDLRKAYTPFTSQALKAGRAREMVVRARRVIDRISESVTAASCPDCY